MPALTTLAQRLGTQSPSALLVSVYLDLDPEEFATPPARQSQIDSLIDGAREALEARSDLSHDELVLARDDLDFLRGWLTSDAPPFQGARALAVFRSGDELFETVSLQHPVAPQAVIARGAHIAPLVQAAGSPDRWAVALVSRAEAWILTGTPEELTERSHRDDDVHQQMSKGGWSQARYQRSVEKDVDEHLRAAAEELHRRWRRERFTRVVLGGPQETVPRFEAMLHDELRRRVVPERLNVDLSAAGLEDVQAALGELALRWRQRRVGELLGRLAEGIGAGGRAVGGVQDTLGALNERRVEVLLLDRGFEIHGARCPTCGMLVPVTEKLCPADGSEMEILHEPGSVRDAVVWAALAQDAEVVDVGDRPDLGPHRGVAALLRF